MDVQCRLCLDQASSKLVLSLANEEIRLMVDSVFNFEITSVAHLSDSVCLQCSATVQEFYKYSQSVQRNQQLLASGNLSKQVESCESVQFENVLVDGAASENIKRGYDAQSHRQLEDLRDAIGDCDILSMEAGFISVVADGNNDHIKNDLELPDNGLRAIGNAVEHLTEDGHNAVEVSTDGQTSLLEQSGDSATLQGRFQRCNECDRLFSNSLHYKTHQREHRKQACPICEKRVRAEYLQRHIAGVHKAKPPSDKKRSKTFSKVQLPKNQYERDRMIDVFIGFRCELCQFGISQTFADLQLHYRTKHDVPGYVRCCGENFSTQSAAAEHVLVHQGTIRCDICHKSFTTKSSMVKHKALQHPAKDSSCSDERMFRCRPCNVVFTNRKTYIDHRNDHERTSCYICGKSVRKNYMKKHLADIHAVLPKDGDSSSAEQGQQHVNDQMILDYLGMRCELCPSDIEQHFEQFKELRTHYRTKHSIRGYVRCCGKQFFIRALAAEHIAAHQGALRCHLCDKTFTARSSVVNHIANMHPSYNIGDTSYDCDECDSTFLNKPQLRLHKKRHKLMPTECSLCGKTVRSDYIQQHIANQHGEGRRKQMCHICGKGFATEAVLNVHIKQHENATKSTIVRVQCSVCNKMIRGKYSMKKHMKDMHSDGSNQECTICGKFIRSNTAMKQHVQMHLGKGKEKLQCPYCAKWVKGKNYLNKHIKCLHFEKGQVFQCDLCEHESPNSQALAAHRQRIHEQIQSREKLECGHCGKNFKRAIYLREHVALHTGELLYTCEFCGKKFKSNANYYSHRKKHHSEELQIKNEELNGTRRKDF